MKKVVLILGALAVSGCTPPEERAVNTCRQLGYTDDQEVAQCAERELEARQDRMMRAAAILGVMSQTYQQEGQPYVPPVPQAPVTTNCMPMGNYLSCTSR